MSDNVHKPEHYQCGGIETIDVIRAKLGAGFGYYCEGNAIKYLTRWRSKGGVEDLRKAQVYLGWLIDVQEPVRDDVRSAEWVAYIDGFPVTGVDTATDRAIEASYAGRVVGASSVDELLIEALIESQAEDPPFNGPESPGEAAPIISPDNGEGV